MKKRLLEAIPFLGFLAVFCAVTLLIHFHSDKLFVFFEERGWFCEPIKIDAIEEETLILAEIGISDLKQDERVVWDQSLMLINTQYLLDGGFVPAVTEYKNTDVYMNACVLESYSLLSSAVSERFGIKLYVSSDFRTAEKQAELLEYYGPDRAAPVGCSEHEAGLALDLYAPNHASYEFLRSPAGREVNRICHEYGFIIRYEVDKTDVTGFDYEPWHLRYVGAPHAELIANSGLAYEEYIEAINPETWYSYENYFIMRTANIEELTLPTSFTSCHISPDNMGCYIVTIEL